MYLVFFPVSALFSLIFRLLPAELDFDDDPCVNGSGAAIFANFFSHFEQTISNWFRPF
jgi:hypothetical protein